MKSLINFAALCASAFAYADFVDGPAIYDGKEKVAQLSYMRDAEIDYEEEGHVVMHTLKTKITLEGDRKFDANDKLIWWIYAEDVDILSTHTFDLSENTLTEQFNEEWLDKQDDVGNRDPSTFKFDEMLDREVHDLKKDLDHIYSTVTPNSVEITEVMLQEIDAAKNS